MTAKHDFLIEGCYVKYKTHVGMVQFVCNSYITILVKKGHHRSHDVHILVYPEQYNLIESTDSK